jgi:hypothetical protein
VSGRIAQLSLAAIRMAVGGQGADAPAVAQWLYRFGTVPRGPAIDRDFGPEDDPMAVLGLTVGGGPRRLLESAYEPSFAGGWYSFARSPVRAQIEAVCKLYVSPRPEALVDAFPRIAEAFVGAGVRSFKVGRGIEGLLRPDKVIAYFEDRTHLEAVAAAIERSLGGCPVQGVPFTAEVGGDGLLSLGVDPPASAAAVSWRSWVTKRLAASLLAPGVAEQRAAPDGDPVAAVLAELRRGGVDPDRWILSEDFSGWSAS